MPRVGRVGFGAIERAGEVIAQAGGVQRVSWVRLASRISVWVRFWGGGCGWLGVGAEILLCSERVGWGLGRLCEQVR